MRELGPLSDTFSFALVDDAGKGLDGPLRREDEPTKGAVVPAAKPPLPEQAAEPVGARVVESVPEHGHEARGEARRDEELVVGVARLGSGFEQQDRHRRGRVCLGRGDAGSCGRQHGWMLKSFASLWNGNTTEDLDMCLHTSFIDKARLRAKIFQT